jgi:tellurite resistance protein TerC
MQQLLHVSYKWARRVAVAILGGTVLLIGVAMIVLPGPSVVVIPVGLAILSLEFAWARRWLDKVKSAREHVTKRFQGGRKSWMTDDRRREGG